MLLTFLVYRYNANSAAQPVNGNNVSNLSNLTSVIKEMTCSKADGWKKDKDDIQKPSNAVLQEFKCNKGAMGRNTMLISGSDS